MSNTNTIPAKGRAIFESPYNDRVVLQWIDVKDLQYFPDSKFKTNAKPVKGGDFKCPRTQFKARLLEGADGIQYVLFMADYSVRLATEQDLECVNNARQA